MRIAGLFGMLGLLVLCGPQNLLAQEAQVPPLSKAAVHLILSGPIPAEWPPAIRDYVQETLYTPTDLRIVDSNTTAAAGCCAITNGRPDEVSVCVDFGDAPTNAPAWEAMRDKQRCGTVRVAALKPTDASDDQKRDALWLPRVQKQTAFVAAELLGKADCSFPLCVMYGDPSMEAVDFKARGMCPPCHEEMLKLLHLPN